MKNKLVIIGVDSLEKTFVDRLVERGVSRGFALFKERGIVRPLKSTFPPDTLLAWPTIYTGLLPHRFGLRPEPEDMYVLKRESIRVRRKLMGKTFWDIASKKGKKVLIINPIFCYPPWRVNGVMITGPCFGVKGETLSQPPLEHVSGYKLGTYGKTPLLPHEYKLVWNEALEQLVSVFKLAYKMINEDTYDVVFIADYTLDRIQHYYWRFEEPDSDSQIIQVKELRNAITNYYRLIDDIVYRLIKKLGDEYAFLVLGDHGHKERPRILIALDDIFNRHCKRFDAREVIRHVSYTFLHYTGLSNISYYFVKKLQERGLLGRLVKKREASNSICNPLIETSWEFGLKEYVGIKIRGVDSERSREEIARRLLTILLKSKIVELAVTPSQYYDYEFSGQIDADVDLYIKLVDGLGNMQSRGSFKCLPNYTRRIISGGHAMYSLFMLYDPQRRYKTIAPIIRIQDVAPSILNVAGIHEEDVHFDGIKVVEHV